MQNVVSFKRNQPPEINQGLTESFIYFSWMEKEIKAFKIKLDKNIQS